MVDVNDNRLENQANACKTAQRGKNFTISLFRIAGLDVLSWLFAERGLQATVTVAWSSAADLNVF